MPLRTFVAVVATVLISFAVGPGLAGNVELPLDYVPIDVSSNSCLAVSVEHCRHNFETISIPGFSSSVCPGNPALPCKVFHIALPLNADVRTVHLDLSGLSTQIVPGLYNIAPANPAITASGEVDWGTGKQIEQGRNRIVYDSNEFYPKDHVCISAIGSLRGCPVAEVEFWPYAYNPISGVLRRVSSASIDIFFESAADEPSEAIRIQPDSVDLVSNPDDVEDWYPLTYASALKSDYVIITTRRITSESSEVNAFCNVLYRRGFKPRIVTEEEWGGGVGNIAADNIRKWLAANYASLGIEYVLLIGNPNPTSGDVPMKMLWPRRNYSTYKDAPSDYYYADLTGNWDLDGDGYAGEGTDDFGSGGIDTVPEVYVGRIPFYGSISDLDHILQKTIDYECANIEPWRKTVILPMRPLDSTTLSYQLGEQIRNDITIPAGLDTCRIYNESYGLNPPPELCTPDEAPVSEKLKSGVGLAFWMSHGSSTEASAILRSVNCSQLNDATPVIVFQSSCSNGSPESADNLGYSLLLHGAVATISASRVVWYYIGEYDYSCADSIGGFNYQFAKFSISNGLTVGRALACARLSVPIAIWANHLAFNLYGDPSIAYNSPIPGAISGRVTSVKGDPVPGAVIRAGRDRVTISGEDGSYFLGGLSDQAVSVYISSPGYYPQEYCGVSVAPRTVTHLDLRLVESVPCSIFGFVRDVYGRPISGVSVVALDSGQTALSAKDGSYTLDNLAPGAVDIEFSKDGYFAKILYNYVILPETAARYDITLVGAGYVSIPAVPAVHAADYIADPVSITGSWYSVGPDVDSYEYAISSTPGEEGIITGGGWINVGKNRAASRTGLSVKNGCLIYVLARAINSINAKSGIGTSQPIRIVKSCSSIHDINSVEEGMWVKISDVIVARMGEGPQAFIQDIQRTMGVTIYGDWLNMPYVNPGTRAVVIGRVFAVDGMFAITDAELIPSILSNLISLGMRNSSIGANNSGLLITTWGRVMSVESNHFILDDGSLTDGLEVQYLNGVISPELGQFVAITGISSRGKVIVCRSEDIIHY